MGDLAEGLKKDPEKMFGAPHPARESVSSARRIVVKVSRLCGTSQATWLHACMHACTHATVHNCRRAHVHAVGQNLAPLTAKADMLQVGTAVVTRGKDQRLALGRLGALVEQLEALVRSGRQLILVSSGAVSVGRQKLRQSQILNSSPLEMQMAGTSTVCSKLCHPASHLHSSWHGC